MIDDTECEPSITSTWTQDITMRIPIEIHDGHVLLDVGGDLWILDTGSPASMGTRPLVWRGETHQLPPDLGWVDVGYLASELGREVIGLVGADQLQGIDIVFALDEGWLELGTSLDLPTSVNLPVEWIAGVPVVPVRIAGTETTAFLDTGAPVSYSQEVDLGTYPPLGTVEDFYPGFGSFQSRTAAVPIEIGDVALTIRVGRLPDELGMMLAFGGVTTIVGTEVMRGRHVMLSYARSCLQLTPG